MWFRLASANWTNTGNLGTMDSISGSWTVTCSTSGGIVKTTGDGMVTKGGTWTGTFTLSDGATFTSATLTPSSAGTVSTSTSGTTVTITIASVSNNCTLAVVATGGSTGDGDGETVTPGAISSYIVDPWAVWSDGRESATSGYYSVVDYPVSASTTYSIPYARNWFCEDSSHTYISGGAVGGSSTGTVTTPANAAYLTVCFKPDDIASSDVTITVVSSDGSTDDDSSSGDTTVTTNPDTDVTTTSYGGIVKAGYMVTTAGELSASSACNAIDMIPVTASTTYQLVDGCRNTACLDSSGAVVKTITGSALSSASNTFTTTDTTTHIRTCYYWNNDSYPKLSAAAFTLTEVTT